MVSRYDSYVYSSSRIAVVRDSERVVARTKMGLEMSLCGLWFRETTRTCTLVHVLQWCVS